MKMYLYEGLNKQDRATMMLWESAGRAITEAQLTADQITKLFQQIEQGATSAGGNRTAIGATKDVAGKVTAAYNDLKNKVADSGPMQNADALYDQAAAKLKQATGGDTGVMKYVEKYRNFAKAHPIAQSLIYGALIAAAGISGAGAGGAAALGLLKMTDKLLQGEKFSSAAIKGAETGALAYGASKLGDLMRGDTTTTTKSSMTQHTTGMQPASDWEIPKQISAKYPADQFDITTDGIGSFEVFTKAGEKIARFNTDPYESVKLTNEQVTALFERAVTLNNRMLAEGRLQEGIWDDIKSGTGASLKDLTANVGRGAKGLAAQSRGAGGKYVKTGLAAKTGNLLGKGAAAVGKKLSTVGHNLTTKVTTDKLTTAWKKAGSPTDSDQIAAILANAGVSDNVISTVFKANSIPYTPANAQPAQEQPTADASTTSQPTDASTAPATRTTTPATSRQTAGALPDISKLSPAQRQQLVRLIDRRLAEIETTTTKPAADTATATPATLEPNTTVTAKDGQQYKWLGAQWQNMQTGKMVSNIEGRGLTQLAQQQMSSSTPPPIPMTKKPATTKTKPAVEKTPQPEITKQPVEFGKTTKSQLANLKKRFPQASPEELQAYANSLAGA